MKSTDEDLHRIVSGHVDGHRLERLRCAALDYYGEQHYDIIVPACMRYGTSPDNLAFVKPTSADASTLRFVIPPLPRPSDILKKRAEASKAFEKMKHLEAFNGKDDTVQTNKYYSGTRGGDQRQVVKTPASLYEKFHCVFDFTHDPAPVKPQKDAMVSPWGLRNYVNPPFKHTAAFTHRACELALERPGECKTVLLCPVSFNRVWFEHIITSGAFFGVVFLRSGIKFDGYENHCPSALCLVLIKAVPKNHNVQCHFWDPIPSEKRRQKTHGSKQVLNIPDW